PLLHPLSTPPTASPHQWYPHSLFQVVLQLPQGAALFTPQPLYTVLHPLQRKKTSLSWMEMAIQSSPCQMNLCASWQGVVRPPPPLDLQLPQDTLLPLLQRGVRKRKQGQENDLPLLAFSPTMGFVSIV